MTPKIDPKELVGAQEIALMLGIKPSYVYVLINRYKNGSPTKDPWPEPVITRSDVPLFLRADIETWAEENL